MSSRLLISSARSLMGHPFQSQAIRPMTSALRQGQLLFTNLLRKNPTVLAQRFMSSKKDEDSKDKKSKNDDSWIKFEFESNRSSNGGKLPTPGPQMSQNFATAFFGSLLLFMMYRILTSHDSSSQELSWEEFRASLLDKGLVEKLIVVNKKEVRVQTRTLGDVSNNVTPSYYFSIGSIDSFERRLDNAQESLGIPLSERIPVSFINEQSFMGYLMPILPTLVLFGSIIWVSKKLTAGGAGGAGGGMGGIFNIGKSRAKLFNQETDVNVKFNDVAGMEEAKEEIMEFVSFLKDPKRYERLGAKIPRGAILSGPPGTGKTLIAKATAGEAGVPFLSVSGSEFVEMFVGVGASRVRDLFKTARDMAPSIIFIDEIDAIGKKRNEGGFTGGNDERESTLNQLLVEMDGFNTSEHIVVLAGTNLPEVLDPALLRPGRFDRHISIDNPSVEGRKEIFMVHLQKITTNLNRTELAGRLAALSPGFSGANIANTCNEAALIAAREDADTVLTRHFEHAIERIIGGLERKSRVLNPEEKRTVAYHEAGHAICGWYFKYADPLLKVSIVPRGSGTLGYAQYLPPDIHLLSYTQLIDRMAMTLGGRTSEEMHFSSVTSGGSDDFKKVTQIATAMVTKYGMSPKLGTVSLSLGEDGYKKPFSEETAKIIDEEVKRIVDEAYLQCSNLLKEKKAEVALVAEELLKKEVITREDMIRLLGKRAFVERNDAFDKYLNDKNGPKTEEPPLAKGEI